MAPTPNKFAPDAAEETAVAAGVISSALEAALGSAPEEEAEEQEETEVSPIASPPPPPLHGESACLHHHHSHHGRRPPRRGPDHYHRHAHPPDRPPRGVAEVFDRLVAGVIRPPRMIYEARALGPNPLLVPEQGLVAVRTDFEVTNARGQRLQCSVWKALDPNVSSSSSSTSGSGSGGGWPCVIYLHGNSSSRVEAVKTQVLKAALAGGAGGVAAFDFSGCGLSEGEFLSLGFFEAQDCAAVVDELRRRFGVGPVVLWGRSMGAVSALLYAATGGSLATQQQQRRGRRRGHVRRAHGAGGVRHADPPPAGLILDSPFSSFRRLALDLTTKGLIRMPRLAVAVVLGLLRSSVKRRASFDLYHVNPLAHAHRAVGVGGIPALFLAAEQDELIPPWHGEALEAQWPGPHKLGIRFPGTHNSARPPIAYALASVFVRGAAVRAREYPALAAAMALRLVERTAVVASQEEEAAAAAVGAQGNGEDDEEGAGDGGESGSRRERRRQRREEGRRRRERERRQQSPFQYGEVGAEEGGEGKRKTKTQKLPPAPHFVRAGDGGRGSLASLPGATRALVAALDSSLAARAVEEYLLEELLSVGVALVAADLREGARAEQAQAQAQAQAGKEAVAGTSKKVPRLAVAAQAQRDLAAATAAPSSAPPVLQAAAARLGGGNGNGSSKGHTPAVGWEAVLKALEAGPEQSREAEATARALAGLRTASAAAAAAAGHDYGEAGPYKSAAVAPMPMPAAPVAQATTPAVVSSRPRFCCFDPQDAHLSAAAAAASSPAAVKRRQLAVVAEAVFADA